MITGNILVMFWYHAFWCYSCNILVLYVLVMPGTSLSDTGIRFCWYQTLVSDISKIHILQAHPYKNKGVLNVTRIIPCIFTPRGIPFLVKIVYEWNQKEFLHCSKLAFQPEFIWFDIAVFCDLQFSQMAILFTYWKRFSITVQQTTTVRRA